MPSNELTKANELARLWQQRVGYLADALNAADTTQRKLHAAGPSGPATTADLAGKLYLRTLRDAWDYASHRLAEANARAREIWEREQPAGK